MQVQPHATIYLNFPSPYLLAGEMRGGGHEKMFWLSAPFGRHSKVANTRAFLELSVNPLEKFPIIEVASLTQAELSDA